MIIENVKTETLQVPEGVKDLRVRNCPGLTSLSVPEGVKDLWVRNCPGLTSLSVPDGVEYLGVDNHIKITRSWK